MWANEGFVYSNAGQTSRDGHERLIETETMAAPIKRYPWLDLFPIEGSLVKAKLLSTSFCESCARSLIVELTVKTARGQGSTTLLFEG